MLALEVRGQLTDVGAPLCCLPLDVSVDHDLLSACVQVLQGTGHVTGYLQPPVVCGVWSIPTVSAAMGLPWSGEVIFILQVAVERPAWQEWVEQAEVRTVITISQDPEQVGVAQPARGRSEEGEEEGEGEE